MQGWFNIEKCINTIHFLNRLKDRIHTVILLDTEKISAKIQHLFIIETLHKLNLIKGIYEKPAANITLNDGAKLSVYPSYQNHRCTVADTAPEL